MHVVRLRPTAAAALVGALLVGGFVVTPPAHAAAITSSHVRIPADPSFFAVDNTPTKTVTISGTTTGGDPATDKVDIRCYYGAKSVKVAGPIALSANGSFSIPAVNLTPVLRLTCRLRAVPAGTTPTDLTPYSGPVVGIGELATSAVSGGANNGKIYDYYFDAQQETAAFDYASIGGCGPLDGFLYDSAQANTTITFACNAALLSAETSSSPTRSELQIDGANAYAPAQAFLINSSASGLPALTVTYTTDAATGNATVHETDLFVKCANAAYPPTATSCASFVSTGVIDRRTITQEQDGHISWITDSFTSTDNNSHSIDLLWENDQRFWGASGDSAQLHYEFPGERSFATHVAGDTVPLSSAVPGAILVRMGGAADGDMSTGQGAIVYDRPTTARFTVIRTVASNLTLHQTGTVPAGGSTRFRFAYVQDYTTAGVASLAQTARNAFLNTVAVSRSVKGKGKVTSSPRGISCGKVCSHGYGYGTSVTLKAQPAEGSRFVRWSGACSGTRTCSITVTGDAAVRAVFARRPCVVPAVVGKSVQAARSAIRKRSCSVGRIRLTPSTVAAGRVVSQTPQPGKRLEPRARISLVVSSG